MRLMVIVFLMLCCVFGVIGNAINSKPLPALTPVYSVPPNPTHTPTQVINTPTLLQPTDTKKALHR